MRVMFGRVRVCGRMRVMYRGVGGRMRVMCGG